MATIHRLSLVLTFSSLVSLVAFIGLVAAQSPHRHCNTSDPPLSRGESGVVTDDPAFVDGNAGRSYDFSIFGLGGANPDVTERPYQICLRYEFVNRSGDAIQNLRWADAGFSHITVQPGLRQKLPVRRLSNRRDVEMSTTQLYAFENILAEGRTVVTLEDSLYRVTSAGPSDLTMFHFSLIDSFPALSMKLRSAGASTGAVPAFYLPPETVTYPTLSIGLESSEISISIESSATMFPRELSGSVNGEIRVVSKLGGPVAVYAPGLLALQRANFVSTVSLHDRSAAFLALLPDSRVPLTIPGSRYTSSFRFRTSPKAEIPALFVIKHPVTVTIGKWSACLIAETYSPVPVAVSEAHCQKTP